MRRLLPVAAAALLWAAPAQAFTKASGTRTMSDGTSIAYDVYRPSGSAPAGGRPGVMLLHGLGGSKDDMAPLAQILAAHGYAVLAYSARGEGTSTGNLELAGPKEISDERALESFFAGLPDVSNTRIGAWGVSYGGGEVWDGLAAGIPYKAAAAVAAWTDLYSALWPQDVAKSGIVAGFAGAVDGRSPLVAGIASDAIRSTNLPALHALAAARSSFARLPSVRTPVYMFQGRVDYAFDVTQAENGYLRLRGPKHLYIGQFGHPPSTFSTLDVGYVEAQTLAWFDHYLKGVPNGIDRSKPVTISAASGARRVSYTGIPKTRVVTVGFRGTTRGPRTGPRFRRAVETFGVSLLRVQVRKVSHFPRLVATVRAGSRVITHGAIVPTVGLQTIRLANYVQYLPRGDRLTVTFGDSSGSDLAYLGFGDAGRVSLGPAELRLRVLTRPVSR
ncbi:MAG: alpha/beta hydrolase family protein [Gaiellaceae bacterium]